MSNAKTVTFRESFPAARLGESRSDYALRLRNWHSRRDAFIRVADLNGWVVTNR